MNTIQDDGEEDTGDCHRETGIRKPTSNDVLLGRGAACWKHVGNRKFREIVGAQLGKYERCQTRIEKMDIMANIVKTIIDRAGRFLKNDPITNTWFTVDRKCAIEKVGHAIRDKRAMELKHEQKGRVSSELLYQAALASTDRGMNNVIYSSYDPGMSSAVLEAKRERDFGYSQHNWPLRESDGAGWPVSLDPSLMAINGQQGRRLGGYDAMNMGDVQNLAKRRLENQILMEQSSLSAAMSSLQREEMAELAFLRRRAYLGNYGDPRVRRPPMAATSLLDELCYASNLATPGGRTGPAPTSSFSHPSFNKSETQPSVHRLPFSVSYLDGSRRRHPIPAIMEQANPFDTEMQGTYYNGMKERGLIMQGVCTDRHGRFENYVPSPGGARLRTGVNKRTHENIDIGVIPGGPPPRGTYPKLDRLPTKFGGM